MAKNRKFMVSTGFVGLTALALSVSPALAAPQIDDTEKKDDRAIVYEVENLGDSVSILEDDLELPENVDFKTFAADVEKDGENVKVEDILDENDEKTGEKLVLTVEEQGTWTFENDLDGNLVKIDFVPVEGFEADPVLDYVAQLEDENIAGTITLDYPNDEEAEAVEPLTEEELAELEKEADKEETTSDDEKADVKDEASEEEAEVSESEETVVKVAPRALVFSAPAQAAAAPVAPAAPAPAEGLDPNFAVPELNGQSDGGTVKLTFGDNGEKLPSGADPSTLMLIIGTGADPESTLSSDRKQLEVPNVGTFKVTDGGNSITFEPVSGYSGTAIGHYVVQDSIGNASNEGRIIVGVSPAAGNNETPSDETDESNEGTPADSTDENGSGTDDPTVSNPDDTSSSDAVSSDDPTVDDGYAAGDSGAGTPEDGTDDGSEPYAGNEAARDSLSHTGVDAGPAGLIAGLLAFFGAGAAFMASRLKREN